MIQDTAELRTRADPRIHAHQRAQAHIGRSQAAAPGRGPGPRGGGPCGALSGARPASAPPAAAPSPRATAGPLAVPTRPPAAGRISLAAGQIINHSSHWYAGAARPCHALQQLWHWYSKPVSTQGFVTAMVRGAPQDKVGWRDLGSIEREKPPKKIGFGHGVMRRRCGPDLAPQEWEICADGHVARDGKKCWQVQAHCAPLAANCWQCGAMKAHREVNNCSTTSMRIKCSSCAWHMLRKSAYTHNPSSSLRPTRGSVPRLGHALQCRQGGRSSAVLRAEHGSRGQAPCLNHRSAR